MFNRVFHIGLRKIVKMPRGFWAGLYLVLLSLHASAGIQAVVSHSVFYYPGINMGAYTEVYWQVDAQSLHYNKTSQNTWETELRTDVVIKNGGLTVVSDHYLLQTTPAISVAVARAQPIIDLKRYTIQPGHIKFEVTLTDMSDTTKKFVFADSFLVPEQTGEYYSDIQLLDTAYTSEVKSIFLKNHKQQLPLCANFYDDDKSVLHYYCELYNANTALKDGIKLTQKIYISRQENEGPLLKLINLDTVLYQPVQPVSGDISIKNLPSGNYYININLLDKDNVIVANKSLFFQRYNTKHAEVVKQSAKADTTFQQVTVLDLHKTFVMQYTLPELQMILKMISPGASPIERQAIKGFAKNPDESYIRYFIYNYFSAINKKNPETAWKEFTSRIKEVNKRFSQGATPGYESDRGIMFLRYGKPDEVLTIEIERGALPYELWQYNDINDQYKNVVFLFYRPANMISGYRLLHTTIPGEVRNANWRNFLFVNGTSSADPDSKAERYIGNR